MHHVLAVQIVHAFEQLKNQVQQLLSRYDRLEQKIN
jgi:hypothetical protein